MDDAVRFHFDNLVAENIQSGMPPGEALHNARRKLGPTLGIKEDARAAWGWVWLEHAWQDVRHGARMFAKNPGLTLVAILSIALGTGVNTAIFTVADAALLRPLPVAHPGDIVTVDSDFSFSDFRLLRTSYRDGEAALRAQVMFLRARISILLGPDLPVPMLFNGAAAEP